MKRFVATASICLLLGTGCQPLGLKLSPASTATVPTWSRVADGANRYDCAPPSCPARIIIYKFAPDKFRFSLKNSATPATIEAWAKNSPNAVFVANGSYFDEKDLPTGLFITGGQKIGASRYNQEETGLLVLSPAFGIYASAKNAPSLDTLTEATQGFPLIIRDGVAVAKFKDERPARRTFIGSDTTGNTYIGAVPEKGYTFANLANFLSALPVKWQNVLNLDGGTSTGFSAHLGNWSETMNSIVQVPNVIIVEKK